MKYEWDENKNETNLYKHGVPFEMVHGFDWTTVIEQEDRRRDYGESRMTALGFIGQRLFNLVYTHRGDAYRVISLRKANEREIEYYEQTT